MIVSAFGFGLNSGVSAGVFTIFAKSRKWQISAAFEIWRGGGVIRRAVGI
jgi:hypothetical protein